MFDIHQKAETEQDKHILRQLIIKQTISMHKHNISIPCGCCSKVTHIAELYKCVYCGIWFCRKCGKIHFENQEESK